MLPLLTFLLLFLLQRACTLENGLARTPPMGWMSWGKYFCEIDCDTYPNDCINENLYMTMAEHLVNDGYKALGYEYVHIDDCWMSSERAEDGKLTANATRFPSGISALAEYIHSIGLKFAMYEDAGNLTCAGYPGSQDSFEIDTKTFADWNIDYLKLDGCWMDIDQMPDSYAEFGHLLNTTGRPIVYSCSWPAYLTFENTSDQINYTLIGEHCNLWRNFDDVQLHNNWTSLISIIDWYTENQDSMAEVHGPGKWNDPDMIIAGNSEISDDQARAQMTLWSIWSAPLIMSNDLRNITATQKEILQNKEVIAVDQDPLGKFGKMIPRAGNVVEEGNISIYLKEMTPVVSGHYSYALAVLNRGDSSQNVTLHPWDLGMTNPDGYSVRDLWAHFDIGTIRSTIDSFSVTVNATGVQFFKATAIVADYSYE